MKKPAEELVTSPPPALRLHLRLERGENALFSGSLALHERLLLFPLLVSSAIYVCALAPGFSALWRHLIALSALLLTVGVLFLRARLKYSENPARAIVQALLPALLPAFLLCQTLSSFYLLMRFELLSKLVFGAVFILFYGLPLVLAYRISGCTPGKVSVWARGLAISTITFLLSLGVLETGSRVATHKFNLTLSWKRTEGELMSAHPLPGTWQYAPNHRWAKDYFPIVPARTANSIVAIFMQR